MKLDLTALLNKRAPAMDFDFSINPNSVEDAPELPYDVTLEGDIVVSGKIIDNDGYMTLNATVSADYSAACDRCLKPLNEHMEIPFNRVAVVSRRDDTGMDEDELLYVTEGGVDFDRDVIEELSLELPIYHLCSEDCLGLCSTCGKPLDGQCKCKAEKEIDPRMETFKKLLEKMEK